MSAAVASHQFVSIEDYLADEESSPTKHEYLGGVVYAMAGASIPHNRIVFNLSAALAQQLKGRRCEPFGSDVKLKLGSLPNSFYYYPDAMIVCDPTDNHNLWRERPSVLFEVVSESTRQVDEREKRIAYLQIPSLQAYVRIEQDRAEIVVDRRRGEAWRPESLAGLDATLRLPDFDLEVPLAELYQRVSFPV